MEHLGTVDRELLFLLFDLGACGIPTFVSLFGRLPKKTPSHPIPSHLTATSKNPIPQGLATCLLSLPPTRSSRDPFGPSPSSPSHCRLKVDSPPGRVQEPKPPPCAEEGRPGRRVGGLCVEVSCASSNEIHLKRFIEGEVSHGYWNDHCVSCVRCGERIHHLPGPVLAWSYPALYDRCPKTEHPDWMVQVDRIGEWRTFDDCYDFRSDLTTSHF